MEIPVQDVNNYSFDFEKPIGRGAYGTVYLAYDESNQKAKAALKMVPLATLVDDDSVANLLMREIEILRQLQGEHVVRLLDVRRTLQDLYIFMDYCDGGDLEMMLKKKYPFTEDEACSIIKQIADVFVTLEKLQIENSRGQKITLMHRDIKPANVMFHQGKVKLADFGFAKIIDDIDKNIRMEHTPLGTPHYTSPQILNFEDFSAKCDVWSTGVLFYEILFGKQPWDGYSPYEVYENIKKKPLTFPKEIREETKDVLVKMLKIEESDRCSWKEVYEHPALNKESSKGF